MLILANASIDSCKHKKVLRSQCLGAYTMYVKYLAQERLLYQQKIQLSKAKSRNLCQRRCAGFAESNQLGCILLEKCVRDQEVISGTSLQQKLPVRT